MYDRSCGNVHGSLVPDGVTSAETDPLGNRPVLLLRLGELLLRAESLVALWEKWLSALRVACQSARSALATSCSVRQMGCKTATIESLLKCSGPLSSAVTGGSTYRHFDGVVAMSIYVPGDLVDWGLDSNYCGVGF